MPGAENPAGRVRALARSLSTVDAFHLSLWLTLLIFLLNPVGDWTVRPFILLLASAGLLIPKLAENAGTWFFLFLLTGWRVVSDWPLSDNHAYLLCYWCGAIFICLLTGNPTRSLALNGRLLIGLAFLFATVWKAFLSGEYLDGTFFRVALLMDDRFAAFSMLAGGFSEETLLASREALGDAVYGFGGGLGEAFVEPRRFTLMAQAATWWTVLLEGVVALSFLWPRRDAFSRMRHWALLLFCTTTFFIAPVYGFGWLLIAMGLAQCGENQRALRGAYLAVFALLLLYREIPWVSLLEM